MQSHRRRSRASAVGGFTLIELLTVMAILAILVSISIVSFQKFQVRAEEKEATAFLMELNELLTSEFEIKKGDYPADDLPDTESVSEPPATVQAGWSKTSIIGLIAGASGLFGLFFWRRRERMHFDALKQ